MPSGNSQGIVVPIQAKIEGWQEQIKQIQTALKQMNVGSDISKGLEKDLKRVDSMVSNLAKNMNQRLTSDFQITAFMDKLRAVDELFGSMGFKLSSISFGDLDINYVTKNFQDLISQIEAAEEALSKGMESSFQDLINNSENLQKAFSKLNIDPKNFNMKELGEELQTRFKATSDELDGLNRKFTETSSKIKGLREEAAEYSKVIKDIGDPTVLAKSIIGDTSQLGVSKELNVDFLKDLSAKLSGVLTGDDSKFSETLKARKEEISNALSELVDAKSIEEARTKLQALYDLIPQNMRGLFNLKASDFKETQEQLTQIIPDEAIISQKMQAIRETLSKYKINEKDLDGMMLKAKDLVREGDFDSLPKIIGDALRRTKDIAEAEVPKIQDKIKELVQENKDRNTQIFQTAATKTKIEKGIQDYNKIIDEKVKAEVEPLRKEIEELRARLEQKATENIHNIGNNVKFKSDQYLAQSTNQAKAYEAQLGRVKSAEQALGKLQGVVQRWFSIYAVIRMVSNAVKSMISTIKELDKTITNIAIVTDMSQDDLWKQMPKYTQMARQYAASISGVYEVSQLYYQQGLEMADVMQLTEATLKMARISGLGYADATDYMTNAVRSFKMEMSEATTVVDVYSAVAASSATSVTELATAMSKTASSAQAVGASFQNTTAMMAVMIEATRESPENIGSALKSIISRYGELKENITGVDAEGEEYSLNKVDKALQSVGISIHDVNGEFRNFDDVIQELADSWDTIDKNTQRYIATVMAGNRQQSRFLALVSSGERLKELSEEAANSEDASQLQFLKTLDSIEAKTQQLQTSIQALYTSSGLEDAYKQILDFSNAILTSLDNIANSQGLIGVITKVSSIFTVLTVLVQNLFTSIKIKFATIGAEITAKAELASAQQLENQALAAYNSVNIEEERLEKIEQLREQYDAMHAQRLAKQTQLESLQAQKSLAARTKWGMGVAAGGLALTTFAASMDVNKDRQLKAGLTGAGGILSGVGTGLMIGGLPGVLMGIVTALSSVMEAFGMWSESTLEKVNKLESAVTEANNERIKSKDELKTLEDYKKKYDELSKSQYESNEKRQEFIDLQNEIAAKYPELISAMNEEGNYIVNMTDSYERLAVAKRNAYKEDLVDSISAEISGLNDLDYVLTKIYGHTPLENHKTAIGTEIDNYESLLNFDYSGKSVNTAALKNYFKNGWTQSGQGTFERLFGNNVLGSFGAWSSNELLDFNIEKGTENLTDAGLDLITEIYMSFVNSVKNGLDLNAAKKEANSQFTDYSDMINAFDEDFYNELKLRLEVPEFQTKLVNNALNSYATEYVNLLADTVESISKDESNDVQKRFIKENLMSEWNDWYKDNSKTFLAASDDERKELISDFFKGREEFWYSQQKNNKALQGLTDIENEFYLKLGQYSKQDIENLFPDWETNEIQGQRKAFFDSIWQQDYETIVKGYTDWLASISDQEFDIHKYSDVFGPEFLSNIQEKYSEILSSNLSSTSKQSQIDILNKIYDTAASESLGVTERNSILTTLHGADLFSITGIYDAITAIEELDLGENGDIITKALNQLSREITINLTTEVSNLLNSYSAQIESFTKDLSNASKGLDFKSAAELADKLGLNLSDFNQIGDKFYLKDLTQLQDYYIQEDKKYEQALRDSIEQKKELYSNTIELPDPLTEIEYFDLEAYINSEDEEYRKQLYDYWAEEIQAISPTWTFENLEKYRNKRSTYIRNNWINEEDFKLSREYITDGTHTKEFNIEEIIKQNQYNLKLIEEELKNNWEEELSDLNIDSSKMLTDIASYIDNGDFSITLAEYTANESYKLLDSVIDAETKAVQYLMASTQLASGDITGFLTTVLGNVQNKDVIADIVTSEAEWIGKSEEEIVAEIERRYQAQVPDRDALINQIQSNNIKNLPEELQDYAKLIYDTYSNLSSNIFSTVTNALEKEEDAVLDVNELNAAKLIESGLVKESDIYDISDNGKVLKTNMVIIPYEQLKNMTDEEFNTFLDSLNDNYADRVKAIGARMARGRLNISADFENVNKDVKNISYEDITQLWHDLGLLTKENDTQEHINELMEQWGLQYDGLGHIVGDVTLIDQEIANLLSKYTNGEITQEEYNREKAKLEQVKEEITNSVDQQKGEALSSIIENYTKVTPEQYSQLMQAFADISTEAKDALESVFTMNADGTRTFDLTKFLSLVKEGIIPISDAVNEMTSESIEEQIDNIRNSISDATKLVTTGTTSKAEMQKWIDKFTAEKIDVTNAFNYDPLISAWTLDPTILKEFAEKQIEKLKLSGQEANQFLFDQTTKVLAQAVDINNYLSAEDQSETSIATQQLYSQLENWAESKGKEIDVNAWISDIKTGGDTAVEKAQEIAADAGKTLTQAEIEAIYSPMATRLTNFASQLEGLTKGQYVAEGEFKEILRKANMIDENGLVTNVENVVKAYENIITDLKTDAKSTAAAINTIEAKKLTALEQGDIDAIAAMGDAMGMTYDALGQILGKEGLDLEQWLAGNSHLYEKIGGGKIRLTNFSAFAEQRGWQSGSEEYTKAFKAYNDALIEYDHQLEQTIIQEVSQLETADLTSKLNFTYIQSLFGEKLSQIVYKYGGILKDGILSFTQDANIAEMFSRIVDLISNEEESILELSENEVANLRDAIVNMLSDVVSLVNTGLEGKLTHTQFTNLSQYAVQNGIGPLDYTETYEGIQLTEDGFAKLYAHLSTVDKKLAKTLLPNITKMSKQYKTLGDVLKAYQKATKNASDAQKQVLEDLTSSMLRNPENYNLMNSELPPELQVGENYYSSLSKGMQVIQSMTKEGKASFSDFYALMQAIIDNTPNMEDRQQALDWMQQSRAYYFDDNGTPMIDVRAMGLSNWDSFQQLQRMLSDAHDNVRKASQLEQKIFDELRFGAESLESAEIVKDGTVNIDKIKQIIESKTQQGENIKLLLDSIKIGNQSLYDMLDDSNLTEQFTSEIRDKLITLLTETNFEFENFDEQTTDLFNQLGLKGTIEFDSSTGEIRFVENLGKTDTSIEYKDGNITFANYNEWVEWQLLKNKNDFTSKYNAEEKITYGSYTIQGNQTINVEVSADGHVSYSFNIDGVGTVKCDTQEQLDAAIAQLITTKISDTSNEGQYYIVEKEGISVQVDLKTGKVITKGTDENQWLIDEINQHLQPYVDQAAEQAAEEIEAEVTPLKTAITNAFSDESVKSSLSEAITTGMQNAFSSGKDDEKVIPIDEITIQPSIIKIDTSAADIKNASENTETLTVEGLKGNISNYDDSNADTSNLLGSLTAYISQYSDKKDVKKPSLEDLTQFINGYKDREGISKPSLEDLPQYISEYKDREGISKPSLEDLIQFIKGYKNREGVSQPSLEDLTQFIDGYEDKEGVLKPALDDLTQYIKGYENREGVSEPSLEDLTQYINGYKDREGVLKPVLDDLTQYIKGYEDREGVVKPSLEDLTQFIKDIDTIGADAALEAWRAKQEAKALNIKVQTSNTPKYSYETSKEFEEAVEKNAVLIESDGEHFTFKIAVDAQIDFAKITLPAGWQFNEENQTLTTSASWYIPAQLIVESGEHFQTEDVELELGTDNAKSELTDLNEQIEEISTKPVDINDTAAYEAIKDINAAISAPVTKEVYVKEISTRLGGKNSFIVNEAKAQGNVALAGGRRQTLMGELGPELYVQNGHYYIAGAQGPEMVSLDDDAIVFNHIQTRRLMAKGSTYGHGKPVTNEYEAAGMSRANGQPNWTLYQSWGQAKTARDAAQRQLNIFGDTTEESLKSAVESLNTIVKEANTWMTQYNEYILAQKQAAEALEESAETLQDAAENTEQATKEQKKAIKDSNRLHTGYNRVNSDGSVVASSANNGMYKATTPIQSWGSTQVGNDSYLAKSMKQLYGAINGASVDVEKIKQQVSSVITKLLEVGFESIDLSSDDFKELDASTKSLMQEYIKRPDASYRDFVRLYGEKAGYTVQEFNEQYFAAWQKDNDIFGASSEMKDAARNLSFFANGAVGGSAEDWTTLFGNATSITDLVDAGIIDWNAKLGQFVITSMEKLQEFDTNLDIEQFQDIIADGLRTTMSNMMDLVSKGASGSLSHEELGQLNGYLETYNLPDISKNMISETADGLKVSNEYLFHFYDQLKKVDALQARIAFKQLKQSLEESNDNFKTMDRLLGHMSELQKKIQDTSKYSDEKIQQYQEELELCQEIAAVRATTEDNSMNFLDQEIPGGMNNPLNYITSWATFIKDYRQAAEEGGAIDFKEMYNAMNHVNNLASIVGKPLDFLGNQLDGSAEKIHAAMMKLAGSLGFDSEGNYGVLLNKFAADFTNGVDGFAASAKEGLKTMAESQIKILDGLIAMFEAIAAMESFKGADIDLNGILDFKEIFIDTENAEKAIQYTDAYTKCAQEMSEKLGADSILAQAYENIKVNGYSLKEIIEDAINGLKSIDISSLDLAAIMSKLFEGLSTDDYSKTDIANSLNDWFAGIKLSEATTVDLGDVVLTTNGKIVKGPNSTFITPGGQTFGTVDEAVAAAALEDFKTGKEATDAKVEQTAETDITITSSAQVTVTADTAEASKSVDSLTQQINSISTSIDVDLDTTQAYKDLNKLIEDIEAETPSVDVAVSKTTTEAGTEDNESSATGNAMAGGTKETLMGELGPELYVTNGHYYVAGQNGAEFVKLPKDAIVFNHLQTQRLLNTGSSGRGKPITNERNAVSLARGTTGPAAANVQETLNVLYELRAMWQTIADMSVKDLAGLGASKDSSDSGDSSKPASTWLAQVERWYDLLQKIARLEKEINYQEALRNKLESDRVPNGREYFDTQVQSLDNLKQQALAHKELAESQEDYFNQRRKELNERKSPFAKFYTFDEGGQLKYQPGAFDKLSDIVAQDEWGRPKYTPQQQYDLMKSYGFESYMKYDNSGNPIDQSEEGWQLQAVQAVWERMEAEQKEMQTLYDSKEEQKVKYLDSINNANKLLQEMVDNQIDLEKQVVSAIEEREQAVINALSDERQALADSTNAYIKGLQDSLDKERKMREKNDSDLELSKLQSRLSMLQRGGGSAAEIANLQREISDKQTDMYFDAQSQQIEAIQDASDLQLEKLQTQIDLMSESLAYAKENGLLWAEATEIMKQNPEVIAQFITDNSPDFASQSIAAQTEELRKILFSAEQFASYYDYIESLKEGKTPLNNTLFDLNTAINDGFEIVVANDENKEKQAYEEQKKQREEEAQRWEVEQEQRKADEKAQQNAAAIAHENEMYDLYGAVLGMSRTSWDKYRAEGRLTDESLQEKYNIDKITQKIQELQMDVYREMQRNQDNPQQAYWSNQSMEKAYDQIEALEALRDKLRFEGYAKEQGYTRKYAHGGLVNYTGLAMVHGSDARPEAFLNADEVKVWKEDILGSSSHSLTSQMLEMQSLYEKFNSTISSTYHNNSEGINIERVDVNMNVAQLANDYDARRAGREVMNEILNIANKSSSGNRVGR